MSEPELEFIEEEISQHPEIWDFDIEGSQERLRRMFRKSNVENIVLPLQIVVHRVLFRVVSLNGVFSGVLSDRTAYLDPNMSLLFPYSLPYYVPIEQLILQQVGREIESEIDVS